MRPYQRSKIFLVQTPHRGVQLVWPCNCYCAVARGHLGRRALKVGRVCHGLFFDLEGRTS